MLPKQPLSDTNLTGPAPRTLSQGLLPLKAQLGRPFEHEARLKDLLARQAQLNACLDLDKHEAQVVDEPREPEEKAVPASFAARILAENRAAAMVP